MKLTALTTGRIAHDSKKRLDHIVETMREMSQQVDPQEMVRAYAKRMAKLMPIDRRISLSRRELDFPKVRITRYSGWTTEVNPWKEKDRLPVLDRGIFSELIYRGEPTIIDDLELEEGDPAVEYLEGQRSLLAVPQYDGGEAINMVISTRSEPGAFDPDQLPEYVWIANLFGRATHNLVLSAEVKTAYAALDHELTVVGDIQKSLLPDKLPEIANLELASFYRTAHRAGGDYYDVYPLPENQWGFFIADVSGHGTPAAVLMAVTHALAHGNLGPPTPPGRLLATVNRQLCLNYTKNSGTFVTAFYGIYQPAKRILRFACAGHNPPLLKHCGGGGVEKLDQVGSLPMGVLPNECYDEAEIRLQPGDRVIFYTDGITEATSPDNEHFGLDRMMRVMADCGATARELCQSVVSAVDRFTAAKSQVDDQTLLVIRVKGNETRGQADPVP